MNIEEVLEMWKKDGPIDDLKLDGLFCNVNGIPTFLKINIL